MKSGRERKSQLTRRLAIVTRGARGKRQQSDTIDRKRLLGRLTRMRMPAVGGLRSGPGSCWADGMPVLDAANE